VILSTLPAMVALFSRLVLGERLGGRSLAAVVLAFGGIALLQFVRGGGAGAAGGGDDDAAPRAWLGNALMVATVCCEALYVVIGKRLAHTRSPLRVSALINVWGLALMAPLGLWQLSRVSLAAVSTTTWGLLVFYGLSASLFAVWLWMSGLRRVPAHRAGVFTVALPIAATAVGVAFLGETFTLLHGLALACAGAGLLLTATSPPQRA
jgi:drug/metabolite transporter (DMT)-like permease